MAEMKEAHLVDIPNPDDDDNQNQKLMVMTVPETDLASTIEHHPLMEIADSPGHLLLLKLWQREEHIYNKRIGLHETRMSSIRTELFQLCSYFFIFHALFLTLVFTSSSLNSQRTCKSWWVPAVLSGATSFAIVVVLQIRVLGYWRVWRRLEKERAEGRAVVRGVQELRMKGIGFDLGKEVVVLNGGVSRMKRCTSVEKTRCCCWPVEVLKRNLISVCVACFAGLMPWACKFILCV